MTGMMRRSSEMAASRRIRNAAISAFDQRPGESQIDSRQIQRSRAAAADGRPQAP